MDLQGASIAQVQQAFRDGALVPEDLLEATLQHIEARNGTVAALTQVFADTARQEASRRVHRAPRGALWGIPWVAKENLATRLGHTTCCSEILRDYRSPFDATAVQRLQDAGATLVGKANCDEFAMGSTTEHSAWGPTRNPWKSTHVPGGSSGGSAAAVAAGFASFALGSDTGGSVRQPAAWCGIVGFKPTYGRISRFGLVSFANSLDHVGILSRSVQDAECVLECIAGADPRDGTSLRAALPAAQRAPQAPAWRLGIPWRWIDSVLGDAERRQFAAATETLAGSGARLCRVDLPDVEHAARCYHVLAAAEAATNLARFDGMHCGQRVAADTVAQVMRRSRSAGMGAEVKKRILLGTFVLTEGYEHGWWQRARALRRALYASLHSCWQDCDALLLPTTPTAAVRLGQFLDDPLEMVRADTFTTLANLTGVPAITVPSGLLGDLPLGVQLLGPLGNDRQILRIASWAEEALAFVPLRFGSDGSDEGCRA